ncbi:MAG: hypothetical protein ABR924_15325 [Terracidiphilus sp.]|jgi:hypothetical protein
MPTKLHKNPTIYTLATDLGLKVTTDPVAAIKDHCHRQIKRFLKEFSHCTTLSSLLGLAAQKLGTTFREIHYDADLVQLTKEYADRGESCAVFFNSELTNDVYGVTFKLLRPGKFDLPYISLIDCRGSKKQRCYFTKWHELGHLLILTDQRRLAFKRTHALHELKSPEESMVDVIAGEFAYYAPMVRPYAKGDLTFEAIDAARTALCPEGSYHSALIGLVRVWPTPCVLVEAKWAGKKASEPAQDFSSFALRAVSVLVNDSARQQGIQLHKNFRVPERSVIHSVFSESLSEGTGVEDLCWWESSDGTRLEKREIRVSAKRIGDTIHALLIPR